MRSREFLNEITVGLMTKPEGPSLKVRDSVRYIGHNLPRGPGYKLTGVITAVYPDGGVDFENDFDETTKRLSGQLFIKIRPDQRMSRRPKRPLTDLDEVLAAKALHPLLQLKNKMGQPTTEPETPTVASTQPQVQQPQKSLAQLQQEKTKLDQLINLKGKIDQLIARADRTHTGIPRGLAADLEIDFTPKSGKDYDDLIALYQRQIKQLSDFINYQRTIYRD
jgi:hypothetical protein